MVQTQQTNSWRSSFGSDMGDPAPAQQQATTLDEDILTMMVMRFHPQPAFRKPLVPLKRFQVETTPPGKQARVALPAGSAQSSVHLGESAADYSQRTQAPTWEESPSPSAKDRQ